MTVHKPPFTTSLALLKAGETMPLAILHKVLKESTSAFGLVCREPQKLVIEKFAKLDTYEKNVELLQKIEASDAKKYARVYTFHEFPPEFDEDEVMPWTVLKDSKGNPLLVVAIEGDFPDSTSDEYSEPYMVMHDWLGPRIEQIYSLAGNNVSKVFDYMRAAQFAADWKAIPGHRGCLVVMPTTGEPFMLAPGNELGTTGPWGEISNCYGITDSVAGTATPEEISPGVTKSKYATDDTPAKPPEPAAKPPVEEPKPDTTVKPPAEEVEEMEWKPPANLHGKPLKEAYRKVNNGELPAKHIWQNRLAIKIKVKKTIKDLKELDQTAVVKDMKPAAPAPAAKDDKITTMPIISGDHQKASVEFIKKHLADGSVVIDDPLEAQRQVDTLAKFSDLNLKSKDLKEILRWRTSFIFAYVKNHPEAAALLVIQLRDAWLKAADIKLGDLTDTEKVTERPPAEAPVVIEPAKTEPKRSKYA